MAFAPDQYELLDFRAGWKLERFGPYVLERPAPAATGFPGEGFRYIQPAAQYERVSAGEGRWRWRLPEAPESWTIAHGPATFELRPTPFGHVGLFPEQAANWDWLAATLAAMPRPVRLLNLFAYTGGSTLAAAAAGAEVAHVDAAANIVAWARRNAELSGLAAAPIRWLADDARKFVARELRRGRPYDAFVLDPPSYGHGPKGEAWRIERDLPGLLRDCRAAASDSLRLVLVTCHTADWDEQTLGALVSEQMRLASGRLSTGPLTLSTNAGRVLPCGVYARWSASLG